MRPGGMLSAPAVKMLGKWPNRRPAACPKSRSTTPQELVCSPKMGGHEDFHECMGFMLPNLVSRGQDLVSENLFGTNLGSPTGVDRRFAFV